MSDKQIERLRDENNELRLQTRELREELNRLKAYIVELETENRELKMQKNAIERSYVNMYSCSDA